MEGGGNMSRSHCLFLLVGSILSLATQSVFADVTIVNSSFESGVVSSPWYSNSATGWTIVGTGGVLNPVSGGFGGAAPDGRQVGWTDGNSSLIKDVGPVSSDMNYFLSLFVGARTDVAFGNQYQVILGYGGHDLATTHVMGTLDSPVIPAAGTYAHLDLEAYAPIGASGELLIILRGEKSSTGQSASQLWDDIHLSFSAVRPLYHVPEISSFVLAVIGGMGLVAGRRLKFFATSRH